jgi:hypothetical protein
MQSLHLSGTYLARGLLVSVFALAAFSVVFLQTKKNTPEEDTPKSLPWFEDITQESGLHFVHVAGPTPEPYFFPHIMGSGGALFDFDNDGRLDVYLVQNGGPGSKATNRLFHQLADGRFEDVSAGSGLDVAGYGMGVAIGDVNNDGLPDVLLTEYGRIRLFLNLGGGRFRDITREAGLDNPHWGTSAAFFDFDRDGWLDLIVVNYVIYDQTKPCVNSAGQPDFCDPLSFSGTPARLFRNRGGATVRFEDVTEKAGLGRTPSAGLGVVCLDVNGDHWPDILVANDSAANHLWINQRDGTFKEEALARGLALDRLGQVQANMGIAVGDVDGEGLMDVFITHLPQELPVLWKQGPAGQFQDRTGSAGLAASHWRATGFGAVLGDFDNDGALDLAVVNGAVTHVRTVAEEAKSWDIFAERNQLFANEGGGRFRDISLDNPAFCGTPAVSRCLACGDLNNDGSLDLLVSAVAGPARLYRNVAPKGGHWLLVRAVDNALGGRDCYGAEITVSAAGRRWLRQINPGYSYLCSNDPRAHFGLGEVNKVDSIAVVWPDGTPETFAGQGIDKSITLSKGSGRQQSTAEHQDGSGAPK